MTSRVHTHGFDRNDRAHGKTCGWTCRYDDDGFLPTNAGEPTKVIGSERPAILDGLLLFGGIFLLECAGVAIVVWWRA